MSSVIKRADSAAMRDAIFRLEDFVKSIPGSGVEESGIRYVHHFAPGVYAREMIVPDDVIMVGAVHRTEHVSIFLEGSMIVPDGSGESVEIHAPIVQVAKPGIKRVGISTSRVRWITIHLTDKTDPDEIIDEITTNDPAEAAQIAAAHGVEYEERGLIEVAPEDNA